MSEIHQGTGSHSYHHISNILSLSSVLRRFHTPGDGRVSLRDTRCRSSDALGTDGEFSCALLSVTGDIRSEDIEEGDSVYKKQVNLNHGLRIDSNNTCECSITIKDKFNSDLLRCMGNLLGMGHNF